MVLLARPIHQLLGTLGTEGAFGVGWSEELLQELVAVAIRPRSEEGRGWTPRQAAVVAGYVRDHFPDSGVSTYTLAGRMDEAAVLVRDRDDAHVVAVALALAADDIITRNTADFDLDALRARGIRTISPDAFLEELYVQIPEEFVAAVRDMVPLNPGPARYPATEHDILSLLSRAGCPTVTARLCTDLGLQAPDPTKHASELGAP